MNLILVIILAIVLVAIAFASLAIQVLLKKNGKFPNTHVGGNPYLQRQGISCAKTQDKIEQAKLSGEIDFKNIRIVGVNKEGMAG